MNFSDWLNTLQAHLFESIVQPMVYLLGLGEFVEDAFDAVEWFILACFQLVLLFIILRPLEAIIPVHPIRNPSARWNDFIYTALHRLGAFPIFIFLVLDPILDAMTAHLHLQGFQPFHLEKLWPSLIDHPLVLFFFYVLVLDFCDYWYHRFEHRFQWWWGLHSLHHSQQDMNLWSDNRNHLFDDVIRDIVMGLVALLIGVEPSQYVMLVMLSQAIQSVQHANIRVHFGKIGEYLLVSPRFHRTHHAIGVGHENANGRLGGHNYAVLFPIWDVIFGTALFQKEFSETGIRDQLPPPIGKNRNYGSGFWQQQWLGVKRMLGAKS